MHFARSHAACWPRRRPGLPARGACRHRPPWRGSVSRRQRSRDRGRRGSL